MSLEQRRDLEKILSNYNELFDGGLGHYPHHKVHLDIMDGAKPVHARPYIIPKINEETFKRELKHLLEIGVLQPCRPTKWASPTFIIPKKAGRVRWISDFRELNKVMKRNVYPLPVISEVLQKRSGWKYFTKLGFDNILLFIGVG